MTSIIVFFNFLYFFYYSVSSHLCVCVCVCLMLRTVKRTVMRTYDTSFHGYVATAPVYVLSSLWLFEGDENKLSSFSTFFHLKNFLNLYSSCEQ